MDKYDSPSTVGKKLRDGEALATVWDQFYVHCSTIIQTCPGVRRLSDSDREDCVQDVMLEFVRRFGEQWPEATQEHMNGWIRLTSRNKAADIVRRRFRKPEVLFGDGTGEGIVDRELSGGNPEASRADDVSLIWETLLSLDHKVSVTSYLIFYLRSIEGWEVAELAELFGIAPDQVRFRCHRVKKKFGTILEAKGQEHGGPHPSRDGRLEPIDPGEKRPRRTPRGQTTTTNEPDS